MIPSFFKSYTAEDFVLDSYFRTRVQDPSGSTLFLSELIETFPEKKEEILLAAQIITGLNTKKVQHSSEYKEARLNHLLARRNHQNRLKVISIVSLIVGLLFLSIILLLPTKKSVFKDFYFCENVSFKKPTLLLADDQKIALEGPRSLIHFNSEGTVITMNGTLKMEQKHPEKVINQMFVPYGECAQIILPDGTRVWLNSGSRLAFLPVFEGKKREVFLEGEAYFEVKKDSDRPFYVRTEAFDIRVFGTRFDVKAIKKDKLYNTVLLEGSIRLQLKNQQREKKVFLVPNQMASLSESLDSVSFTEVTKAENNIAWIDGYLIFDDEDISCVLKRVSEYYNIPITLESSTTKLRITGKLDLKTDIVRVLDGLALLSRAYYSYNDSGYSFGFLNKEKQ